MHFQLVPKSLTLDDLELPTPIRMTLNNPECVFQLKVRFP